LAFFKANSREIEIIKHNWLIVARGQAVISLTVWRDSAAICIVVRTKNGINGNRNQAFAAAGIAIQINYNFRLLLAYVLQNPAQLL
jgi:hypothetical protein